MLQENWSDVPEQDKRIRQEENRHNINSVSRYWEINEINEGWVEK